MDANQIQNLFASNVRQLLVDADLDYDKLYEIRLRVGRPLFLTYDGGECFLRQKDTEPYLVTREDLKETLVDSKELQGFQSLHDRGSLLLH